MSAEPHPSRAPLCTDEPVDRFFSRPVATLLVKLLAPTGISPNGITALAALSGLAAGWALGLGQGGLAAVLIAAFLAFDCADGQLARLRGATGYLGRAVDGLGDYAAAAGTHLGMAYWMTARGMPGWLALVLMFAAGVSMSWSSFLVDRYKRRYSGAMDDLAAIRAEAASVGGFSGWLIGTLVPYATRLDGGVSVPDLAAYQQRVRAPFQLWRLSGPTMHFSAMAVCFACGQPELYVWIALGPLNVLSLGALLLQRRLELRAPAVIERTLTSSADPA